MKKLILLLFIPLVSFGQEVVLNEYYNDGKKVIEKTWKENEQTRTLIEIQSEDTSDYRYYINENGVEIGLYIYFVRDYGRYFKVDVSVVNNSENRINYLEENINVNVNGIKGDTSKYKALKYTEYNKKVQRRQNGNAFLMGFSAGLSNASAGTTYSQSNTYYSGYNTYGYANTYTTTYSPALASMQIQQNQRNLDAFEENQNERMKYINEGYLKNHTIFPNNTLEGYFLIPFNKKISDVDIILNVEDMEFDFSTEKWGIKKSKPKSKDSSFGLYLDDYY